TVHFTSSDPQAVLPADATLTASVGTFSVTLKTAGPQTVTATDAAHPLITGTSSLVAVAGVPSPPRSLTAAAQASGIQLNWQPPTSNGGAAITSYAVFRGLSSGAEGVVPVAVATGTAWTDSSVTGGVR